MSVYWPKPIKFLNFKISIYAYIKIYFEYVYYKYRHPTKALRVNDDQDKQGPRL